MENPEQKSFETQCLVAHNKYRALHGAPPLKINPKLTEHAKMWAQELLKSKEMEHSKDTNYGENIYFADGAVVDGEMPVKSWYDEIEFYNFDRPGFSPRTGHFTQVIWRDTLEVGVGVARSGRLTYVVANYNKSGNVLGQFKENVLPKLKDQRPSQARAQNKPEEKPVTSKQAHLQTDRQTDHPTTPTNASAEEKSFEQECLEAHNKYRALHGVPPLKIKPKLSEHAQRWAQVCLDRNELEPSRDSNYGETICFLSGVKVNGERLVKTWYDEITHYDFRRPGYSFACGHFTQLVWKDTTDLGIGIARKGRTTVVVVNYYPPGNVLGKFEEKVTKPMYTESDTTEEEYEGSGSTSRGKKKRTCKTRNKESDISQKQKGTESKGMEDSEKLRKNASDTRRTKSTDDGQEERKGETSDFTLLTPLNAILLLTILVSAGALFYIFK